MSDSSAQARHILQKVSYGKLTKAEAARLLNVSRKTVYSWLKEFKFSFDKKYRSKRSLLGSQILKIVSVNPLFGPLKISSELKKERVSLSVKSVWLTLKELNLETQEKRTKYSSNFKRRDKISALKTTYIKVTPEARKRMVEDVIFAGKKVADVIKYYGVSRKTFAKWKRIYLKAHAGGLNLLQAVSDNNPRGSEHPRGASESIANKVVDIVISKPYLSSQSIANELGFIGNHGVQRILERSNLSRYEQRMALSERTLGTIPAPVAQPAVETIFTGERAGLPFIPRWQFLKTFIFASLLTFATIFSLLWWINLISERALSYAIGIIFASVALLMGSVFFLYSLKYYLSLAIVLSFSQQEAASGERLASSRKRGILSWILGIANGRGKAGLTAEASAKAVGLTPNLEHVTLKRYPKVSVHIPLYNEKNVVERILNAATSFDYQGDYEVIIADDSTDETTKIVLQFLKANYGELRFIRDEQGNEIYKTSPIPNKPSFTLLHRASRSGFKGGALREALRVSDPRAEFVSVFDADFVPYPDTLELFLKYFKVQNSLSEDYSQSKVAAVQGYQWHVLNKSENWVTRGVRSEYAGSYVIERSGAEIYTGLKQISGSVYMIRRDVLEEIGWETSITEDFQLTLKLYEKGYKVVYTPYIQAPAECVSTLKRLIRQRMRWAEGHSNNIKKMFARLMYGQRLMFDGQKKYIPSPLKLSEKFEFLYLSPYYLQSFFFLVGTFSWLISETLLPARLPFWTSLWGWSLVLTNFLSLPLMNAVGLFLEESEEKDYSGLVSFVVLSYLLVPFQAYASLKGFLQKEEGPWFRTPKTGRITDIIRRGTFYRLIAGILPGRVAPAVSPMEANVKLMKANKLMDNSLTRSNSLSISSYSRYVALATANSRFNSFNIRPKSLGARWVGRVLVTVFLITSTTMLYFSPSIPSYPDEVSVNHSDFRWDQTPRLILDLKGARSLKQSILPRTNEVYAKGEEKVSTKIYYQGEEKDIPLEVKELESGKLEVALLSNESIKPGKYKVVATAERAGKDVTISQDFTWGVLAIGTDKSTYLPGGKVSLSFAVLNDKGNMVCDAFLRLKIKSPEGKEVKLSTEDGTIKVNPDCSRKGYTQIPDYEAEYEVGEAGRYEMELSALTENGPRSIEDSFEVRDWVPFDIQRQAPTRIYPLASYPVKLKVKVNEDFKGQVIESVPDSFEILNPKSEIQSKFLIQNSSIQNRKEIVWNVDWKKGETYELSYEFNAPIISPEFYLMGPLTLRSLDEGGPSLVFQEARRWQVASDSTQPSVQSVTGQTAGAVTQVVVNSVPGGTNQLYIAIGHFYTNSPAVGNNVISSMNNAGGLTWDLVDGTRGCTARISHTRIEWWWAFGSPSTFNATVDLAGTGTLDAGAHIAIVRIDGAVNQEPINGEYSNTNGDNGACDGSGTDNTAPTIGLTISNSTSLALNSAHPRNQSNGVTTPDSDYTEDYEVLNISGGNASTIWAGHRTNSPSIGTETITHSLGSARPWIMVAAEIVVPEYSLIWLGLAPFLPGIIGRLRGRRKTASSS